MPRVLSLILGGGKGTRLYPLTKERSKPAVPFGGKHRIVDIPISNCINSGFRQIYILTQFNSASLHMHIARGYAMDSFSKGFVEILAAEQTFEHGGWYEGTADAVRKNFMHFRIQKPTHYIILSGDQLYQMDLQAFLDQHIKSGANISIASTAVTRSDASGFGILKADKKNRITAFMEKPAPDKDIDDWKIPVEARHEGIPAEKEYLASMGIYIFNADTMEKALDNEYTDFGKEIIPQAINTFKVNTYIYDGYWEDIGTIKSFYDATLDLTSISPKFNFYNADAPIYTHARHLPSSKMNHAVINQSITAEGCIITNSDLNYSVIGIRSKIESGTYLDGVICMGADEYETKDQIEENVRLNRPNLGIGKECRIRKAIIDKNARIGANCSIGMGKVPDDGDYGFYHVIDGIYIIPKGATIPNGTVI